jgi:hypothetical protein
MKNTLNRFLIAGTICIFLFSACSKTTAVEPSAETLPERANTVAVAAAGSVGTFIFSSNGYTLRFTNDDSTFTDAVREKFVNTFFTVYPQLVNRLYPGATKTVDFRIEAAFIDGVAYTYGTTCVYSPVWFRRYPQDLDVITHELTHVVQAYTGGAPGWLTEGIADYTRYKYGVNNAAAGWYLPAWNASQKYTDAYRVTARFLVWLELRVSSTIVDDLNTALRNQTYTTANTWSQLTGKTVVELWADYSSNPAI